MRISALSAKVECPIYPCTAAFVEQITAKHFDQKESEREVPALRQLISRPSAEKIIHVVEEAFGENKKLARQAAVYLCHHYSRQKVREIGEGCPVAEVWERKGQCRGLREVFHKE